MAKTYCVQEPVFVRKSLPKDDVYGMWLAQLERLERATITTTTDHNDADDNALDMGYHLFPIIDSVSYTLFGKGGRHYLKQLGYSSLEADLAYKVFRNGQLHGMHNRRLVYEDGEVDWGMSSSSGSGGWRPHYPGDAQMNIPADKGIEYLEIPGDSNESIYHVSLSLDRLAAQIRHDLEKRKAEDTSTEIDLIVGTKEKGKRPRPK